MKKINYSMFLVLILMMVLTSCGFNDDSYKDRQYNNRILSKEACYEEIKRLLRVDEIYFFNCDFSNMDEILVIDSSYNISVLGNFLKDNENDCQIVDLSQQAEIFIVANYKIKSEGECQGFSIVSRVMTPGAKHYKNDVLEYETQNEIYTRTTFSSFSELKGDNGNGTIYQSNNTIHEILVPDNFYNINLSISLNPISYYRKYSGSLDDIKVLHTPLWVVTHYENYQSFNNDENFSTMVKIKSYLNENATYVKK